MPPKKWYFLLPASGNHVLQAEFKDHGPASWQIILDGKEDACFSELAGEGISLSGPEGSQLEIRKESNGYCLYVNGCLVEECASSLRNGIRDLRNMPEGSYTIATQFGSEGLELHVVRKYRFLVSAQMHELQLVHSDWSWKGSFDDSLRTFQVIHDGEIVEQKVHKVWDSSFSTQLRLSVSNEHKVDVDIRLYFDYSTWLWNYDCQVNHVKVQECWTKGGGEKKVHTPEVIFDAQDASRRLTELGKQNQQMQTDNIETFSDAIAEEKRVDKDDELLTKAEFILFYGPEEGARKWNDAPKEKRKTAGQRLPEGVSYDPGNGTFQAIMTLNDKFVLLGEFATSNEAHQRYLEAKARSEALTR